MRGASHDHVDVVEFDSATRSFKIVDDDGDDDTGTNTNDRAGDGEGLEWTM